MIDSWIQYMIMIITLLIMGKIYFKGGTNKYYPDLNGKVIVITGANAGIGKETTLELAKLGAIIVMACRSKDRAL